MPLAEGQSKNAVTMNVAFLREGASGAGESGRPGLEQGRFAWGEVEPTSKRQLLFPMPNILFTFCVGGGSQLCGDIPT
jgi:hypothetical protein